jgi:hypothetical protein
MDRAASRQSCGFPEDGASALARWQLCGWITRREEDVPAALGRRGHRRCVMAGIAWRRVRGNGAAAAARTVRHQR